MKYADEWLNQSLKTMMTYTLSILSTSIAMTLQQQNLEKSLRKLLDNCRPLLDQSSTSGVAAVREDKGTDVLPETDALTPDILIRMMDSIVLNQRGVGETDQRSRFEALVKEENITWPVFLNSEVIRVFGEVLLWAVRFKHVAFLQKCMPILMYLKKSSDRVPGETQEIVAACLSKKEEINDRVVKDPVESSHALRTAPAPAAHSTDRGVEVQVPSVVLTLFEQTNSDTAPVNALGGYLECKNENIPEVDHQP